MDQPPAFDQVPADNAEPLIQSEVTGHSVSQRDRRREKPQLSCTFCRRRKVRCDRQLPCNTCSAKGIALHCTYALDPQRKRPTNVREHIQHLESLVRSLLQQQTHQTTAVCLSDASSEPIVHADFAHHIPFDSSQHDPAADVGITPLASPKETMEHTISPSPLHTAEDFVPSPSPSKHGSLRLNSHGRTYVNSVHWAAVLDSISELKDHYEKEEEARTQSTSSYIPRYNFNPRLLYEPVRATKSDILASIPARPVVDRMVARYFNAQGVAPAVLHSGQFLQEYESFWQDQASTSFSWIGLLFSILCLSSQLQHLADGLSDPENLMRIHMFRERTVNCLVLAQFTRAGPHVLESMIIYCANEALLCTDADVGLWLLLGILVQLALSQGYHRDPQTFSNLSPFTGEMRRRVWAAIVQMDLRLSSQMGLPRLLKSPESDTTEPRNLLDSDFDYFTLELPSSRPETEVTPVLYTLAKNRIDVVGGLISDLISDIRERPYSEILELDRKLQKAKDSLPPIFRWQPLSQSFMAAPSIILHRIWLQLAVQRSTIWLHRKYLALSRTEASYKYSRDVCLQAAIKMLEFQQLLDEETQPEGQLQSMRWTSSSLVQSNFLLGMSVVCYYLQVAKTKPDFELDHDTMARIYSLLNNTYRMWLRSSAVSQDAQQAAEHLSALLGLHDQQDCASPLHEARFSCTDPQPTSVSLNQVNWENSVVNDEITSLAFNPHRLSENLYLSSLSPFDLSIMNTLDDAINEPSTTE